jgi:Membrane domain of glycerophosphoryl diester phosphodiesterase
LETVDLRPLSLGELLDRTFSLYRSHFWLFVGIVAIPALFLIPERIVLYNVQGSLFNITPGAPPTFPTLGLLGRLFFGELAFSAVFGLVYAVGTGAATCAVSHSYLGRPSTVRGSYAEIRAKLWRLIGVVVNVALRILGIILLPIAAVGGGLIAAIVAANGWSANNPVTVLLIVATFGLFYLVALVLCVWFALRYAIVIPVLMIEDLGVLDTIRRSVFLTRGRRGHIFLALLVAAIIVYVGLFVFQMPFSIMTMIAAMKGHLPLWLSSATGVASAFGIAVAGPISMIVTVLLYYDTRIRKEAFDLQFMISSLDRPAPAAGTVSPA